MFFMAVGELFIFSPVTSEINVTKVDTMEMPIFFIPYM